MKYEYITMLFKNKLNAIFIVLCIFGVNVNSTVYAATIDFTTSLNSTSQDRIESELVFPEVKITGSNNIDVVRYGNGLGVVGGIYDHTIDSAEWLFFDFTSTVDNLFYRPQMYGNNTVQTVEAYNVLGKSLGTVSFAGYIDSHIFNISDSFGGELLSGFKLQIDDGQFRMKSITFDEVSAVPLPAGFVLFLSGGVFLFGFLFKKQKNK